MALKYLTLKFSNRIIGCKLLTIKQDLDFFNLLLTKLPAIRRFKFLFRASDHYYSAHAFHEYCNDKPGTIIIIKNNWENIFGGFTSKSWKLQDRVYAEDENAFLFLIKSDDELIQSKCPLLLELKKGNSDYAIDCSRGQGPSFGLGDICIRDKCNEKVKMDFLRCIYANYCGPCSYGVDEINICGGNQDYDVKQRWFFQVIDYEVFQIIE